MKLEIKTNSGTVLRTFDIPKYKDISVEEAHKMGETLAKEINESARIYCMGI